MESKKIALACFIGGIFCVVTAFAADPRYWWVGIFAGIMGGYVAYEFRNVCRTLPAVIRVAGRRSCLTMKMVLPSAVKETIMWLSKPHYFVYPAIILSVPLYFLRIMQIEQSLNVVVAGVSFCFIFLVALGAVIFFAWAGSVFWDRSYWYPFLVSGETCYESNTQKIESLESGGLVQKPLTYMNVARWFLLGIVVVVRYLAWTLWKEIVLFVWNFVSGVGAVIKEVIIMVHSDMRILCALNGTLGGVISYVYLGSYATTSVEQASVVFFGGMLGALLGVASYQCFTRKILPLFANK